MLKYVGASFIIGIPAKNLSEEEIADLEMGVYLEMQKSDPYLRKIRFREFLLNSGLYAEETLADNPRVKALRGPKENKQMEVTEDGN